MKLMQFIQGMLLTTCILLFAACKDNNGPIYLVNADNQQKITNGTIELSLFGTGEKFFIRGGEGNYTIKNEDATIADYRYDGETLTFLPVSIGQTSTTISDREGNSYTVSILVSNPTDEYRVESLDAEVEGDNLTKGDEATLKARIVEESPIQAEERFSLIYSDSSLSYGELRIFPNSTNNYQLGIFERTLKYAEDTGEPYLRIEATMAGSTKQQYTFMLFEDETTAEDTTSVSLIKEDVTDQYKGEFNGLTKAYRIYHLIKQ
ncbi:hypothetical protein [Bacteroides mediterraneensis]|uniref:Uncharacterized protein n=1 Tax=Bacteroides mediterraneensis TaxID=1841856 RepID=A0ABS2EVI5_9BACE|nr:hypothetical protein [Bacteroides mediterraneensis]MBM6758578.1 hypothetical protein [Bacteroides mediterraneensis]